MLSLWGLGSTQSQQKPGSGGSLHPVVPEVSKLTDVFRCRSGYLSRWKLVLRENSALCARLYNSSRVPEETNLALYTINQTTLVSNYIVNKLSFMSIQ